MGEQDFEAETILGSSYFLFEVISDFTRYMNAGSAVYPRLNRNHIHPLPVDLRIPIESEQRRVAHILGTLDDKTELNRRMNATLEGMARALFKSWFVDFEPVRAKMEGRWRRGAVPAGDAGGAMYDLFPERLVPSELGVGAVWVGGEGA